MSCTWALLILISRWYLPHLGSLFHLPSTLQYCIVCAQWLEVWLYYRYACHWFPALSGILHLGEVLYASAVPEMGLHQRENNHRLEYTLWCNVHVNLVSSAMLCRLNKALSNISAASGTPTSARISRSFTVSRSQLLITRLTHTRCPLRSLHPSSVGLSPRLADSS